MTSLHGYLLSIAALMAGYLYVTITESDIAIHGRRRFAIALDAGQISSFVFGILIYLAFPFEYSAISGFNIWIGAFIGLFFCLRNEAQLFSAGFFYGGLAAIMGTMVGALAVNPAICGLPMTRLPIQSPGLTIGILSVALLFVTVLLVNYSLKINRSSP